MNLRYSLLASMMTVGLSVSVQAATIISNLHVPRGNSTVTGIAQHNKGMGFRMPSGPDYILESAILRLGRSHPITPTVQIWDADSFDQPRSLVATLEYPTVPIMIPHPNADLEFTSSNSVTLHAGEVYWLVLSKADPEDSTIWWSAILSEDDIPRGVAHHVGQLIDADGPPPTLQSTIVNLYEIRGTPVPEPSSVHVISLLAIYSAILGRRRSGTSNT